MRGVEDRARLIWGVSTGEFLFAALLFAVIIGTCLANTRRIFPKLAAIEVFSLATYNKVYWGEAWAVEGKRAFDIKPLFSDQPGKYVLPGAMDHPDAAISFYFTERMPEVADQRLTIRPAFSDGEDSYSVIWLCGRAPVPRGFTVNARDHTNIADEYLNVSCRSPRT
jgi:hypothetical protein